MVPPHAEQANSGDLVGGWPSPRRWRPSSAGRDPNLPPVKAGGRLGADHVGLGVGDLGRGGRRWAAITEFADARGGRLAGSEFEACAYGDGVDKAAVGLGVGEVEVAKFRLARVMLLAVAGGRAFADGLPVADV